MLLPGWSAWADCSVPEAASFPAPRWRYSLLSAAGWPPESGEKNQKLNSRADVILVQKQAQINFIPFFAHLCRVTLYSCCANIWLIEQHCARARVCQCVHVWSTLLSFSPSVCGRSVFRDWNPALMLCIRRRSLLLAISLRIRLSWSWAVSGLRGMLARLKERGQMKKMIMTVSWSHQESVSSPFKHN